MALSFKWRPGTQILPAESSSNVAKAVKAPSSSIPFTPEDFTTCSERLRWNLYFFLHVYYTHLCRCLCPRRLSRYVYVSPYLFEHVSLCVWFHDSFPISCIWVLILFNFKVQHWETCLVAFWDREAKPTVPLATPVSQFPRPPLWPTRLFTSHWCHGLAGNRLGFASTAELIGYDHIRSE